MAVPVADDLRQRLADDLDAAFADLVVEHQDLVFGVAMRVVGDAVTAQDVAQESFVRGYRALRRYPSERIRKLRLRPWLARITLNQARNQVRSSRAVTSLEDETAHPVAHEAGPHSIAERNEQARMWARLLAGLPERYRVAVALRHVDGLSYSEMAEALDRPLGSLKSDVHRGTALLRAAYDAEERALANQEAV